VNVLADPRRAQFPPSRHDAPEIETLDLVRYWRAVMRNKWRIAGLVAAIGVLATLYAQSLAPVYRATATLLIEASKPKVVSIEEVYSAIGGANREYYQTQVEILKSRDLAGKLVRRLELAKHPEFDPRRQPRPFYYAWVPESVLAVEPGPAPSDEAIAQAIVPAVQSRIGVQLVRASQLVRLSFDSSDPELAAKAPNALAEIFIQSDLEARMQMTRRAMVFLTEQSDELKKKLNGSENALQQFRERERIIDAKGVSLAGASRQLEELTTSLVDARRKRAESEAALNQVHAARKDRSEAIESVPVILRHPLVIRAKELVAEAERRLGEASKRYGSEHPRMIGAQTDIKSAQENLRRQIDAVVQSLSKEYEVAKANEAAIERALERSKADIQSFNRKEFQLAALEREVATNRQLYDMFMQRSKETNLAGEMQSAIARVIDPALVPKSPSGPDKRRIVLLSVLGALLTAVALALLVERLDNTVKTSHEVEAKLEVPALGIAPRVRGKAAGHLEQMLLEDSHSPFAEAIRTLRSGVLLSGLDAASKVVLVTSSVPEEGKTTVASNLALALSQVKKTLLVDSDLRRPQIGKALGGEQHAAGLSDLVAAAVPVERCVYPVANSGLHVLPSGRIPPNPLELLSSQRFADAIEELKRRFEVIVLDSPPVQLVSDALVISQLATSVVYVVKADDTPYPVARRGLKRLRRVGAPVIGVVLNQLDLKRADKYYGEYSGYASKYARRYAK
jgi:capsular exopolysaccharide synthesis family protein